MNLRILKKLSARAAPFLPLLGDHRIQFRAAKGDNYMATMIRDRKHWERGRSIHDDVYGDMIKHPARDGRGWIYLHPPHHPLKGTIMIGGMIGYEEPEWEEETAWCALSKRVVGEFTDWNEAGPTALRSFRNPTDVFRAAQELILESRARAAIAKRLAA